MVKQNKLVTGLIAGAAVGAVAGLLFAPKPGKASRQIVAARTGGIRHRAVRYIDAMRFRRKNKDSQPVLVGPFEWRDVQIPV